MNVFVKKFHQSLDVRANQIPLRRLMGILMIPRRGDRDRSRFDDFIRLGRAEPIQCLCNRRKDVAGILAPPVSQ